MNPTLDSTLGVAQVSIYPSIYLNEPCYVLDIGCGSGNLSIYLFIWTLLCYVLDIGCGSGTLSIHLSIYMNPALDSTLGVAQVSIYPFIYLNEPCYVLDIGCGSGNLSVYLFKWTLLCTEDLERFVLCMYEDYVFTYRRLEFRHKDWLIDWFKVLKKSY